MTSGAREPGGGELRAAAADYAGMALALAALVATFAFVTDHFFTATNFRTIANQIPAAVIVAVGLTFVLLTGGIDLSVGSVLALAGAALGVTMAKLDWPLGAAIAACLAAGLACGLINGFIIVQWRLPSFIVTLGMLEAARGATYLITHSQTQYLGARIDRIAELSLAGLSFPFLLAVAVAAAGQWVLWRTVFGRYAIAVGYSEEVARLSGVNARRVRLAVFALCGLLTALAAVIHTARMSAADPNAGIGFELEAIAAVVIGGTSLSGGRGSVFRSVFGVLVIAVLGNGLAQAGAQEPTKRLITGCVIVAAVVIDQYRKRRSGREPG